MATQLTRLKNAESLHKAARHGFEDERLCGRDVADSLGIHIDADGSPVTFPEAEWLICFVPGLRRQWWHRFAHPRHKHVFAIRKLENRTWLLVEPWWTRLMVNVLTFDQALDFLRWGAAGHILKVRESIPGRGNQMRGWSNCAVLMAFLLGRSYWTWTPDGLYRRLIADPGVESVDLAPLLDGHFQSLAETVVDDLSNIPWRGTADSLHGALVTQGMGLMAALTSPSACELQNAAAQESSSVREAAQYWWRTATDRATASTLEVLEYARAHGEIDTRDCSFEAQRFVMLILRKALPGRAGSLRRAGDPEASRRHVVAVVADLVHYLTHYRDILPDAGHAARIAEPQSHDALACP